MITVNGLKKDIEYRQCVRCVCDNSIPGISFDKQGICSLCHAHDKMVHDFPNDERGTAILEKKFDKFIKEGKSKKYDCIIGVDGRRNSIYLLYLAVKEWHLRPLAVHFNDGFDNPVEEENMLKAIRKLGVELRTITADIRESKDLKIAELKASTPLLNLDRDIGIGAALYAVAYKENVKQIICGQSFRNDGTKPIAWTYFDVGLLRAVHKQYGSQTLRKWQATSPGYNIGPNEVFFYTFIGGICFHSPLNNYAFTHGKADEILRSKLDWVDPNTNPADNPYQSLVNYIHQTKFNIQFRLVEYSALIRSGQIKRDAVLERLREPEKSADEKVITQYLELLGITRKEFDNYIQQSPKNWWDYPNSYQWMKTTKFLIWILAKRGFLAQTIYDQYFSIRFR